MWRRCWRVFRTAMLMLKGAKAGHLDAYEEHVRSLTEAFPGHWGVISVADELMRSERWEEIRRRIDTARSQGDYRLPFDEKEPWGAVIRDAAQDKQWWYDHCNQVCLLARARNDSAAQLTAAPSTSAPPLWDPLSGATPSPPSSSWAPAEAARPGHKKNSKGKGKGKGKGPRNDGRHTVNSKGTQLCYSWGRNADGCRNPCPNGRAHQCEFCLGVHRSLDCSRKPADWQPAGPRK